MPGSNLRLLTALPITGSAGLLAVTLAACGMVSSPRPPQASTSTAASVSTIPVSTAFPGQQPLPAPGKLPPFAGTRVSARAGSWHPAGRLVAGKAAVYETFLVPPG